MLNNSRRCLRRLLAPAFVLLCAAPSPTLAQHLVSWGRDDFGVVSNTPTGSGYTMVEASGRFSLALWADGSIVAWGEDSFGQVSSAPVGTGFLDIATGGDHALALRADGTLVSWGLDSDGQVSLTPQGNQFVQVAAAPGYSMALRSDGTIEAWGYDSWTIVSNPPTGAAFAAITCGEAHAMALRSNGSIESWGSNYYGQVSNTPTGSGYTDIAEAYWASVALSANGTVMAWGGDIPELVNDAPTGTGFVRVAGGGRHMLALAFDGTISTWGRDNNGEVSSTPGGGGYTDIAAGSYHCVAIRGGSNPHLPVHNISGATLETYSNIQTAIDAAADGDTLLVAEGEYAPFTIDGKSLSIFAPFQEASIPLIGGVPIQIRNLGPQQRVVISGLDVHSDPGGVGWGARALRLQQNQGYVYIQDSKFELPIQSYFDFDCTSPSGQPGTTVLNSDRVAFSSCEFTGRGGSHSDDWCSDIGAWSTAGTPAVHCVGSTMTFFQCVMVGGSGGGSSATGTEVGGAGLSLQDSRAFLLGTNALGGSGGTDDAGTPYSSGGPGVVMAMQSELRYIDSTLLGGWGGRGWSSGERSGHQPRDPRHGPIA